MPVQTKTTAKPSPAQAQPYDPLAAVKQQIANAKASGGGRDYFKEGRGRAVVTGLSFKKMRNGPTFIAEHRIITADPVSPGVEPNLPGTRANIVKPINGSQEKHDATMGEIKKYLCALEGIDPETVEPDEFLELLEGLTDADQPAVGALVDFETYRYQTKEHKAAGRGEFYVFTSFTHIPDQDPDEIAARRAAIERGEKVTG